MASQATEPIHKHTIYIIYIKFNIFALTHVS